MTKICPQCQSSRVRIVGLDFDGKGACKVTKKCDDCKHVFTFVEATPKNSTP